MAISRSNDKEKPVDSINDHLDDGLMSEFELINSQPDPHESNRKAPHLPSKSKPVGFFEDFPTDAAVCDASFFATKTLKALIGSSHSFITSFFMSAHSTFHTVYKLNKKSPVNEKENTQSDVSAAASQKSFQTVSTANKIYFFKKNKTNSAMSDLEAYCAALYKFIVPTIIASTHIHYNENKNNEIEGVSSKAISEFKSVFEDPLKEEDIEIDVITKNLLTIPELDEYDEKLAGHEIHPNIRELVISSKKLTFSAKDLEHYRIVKGLAQCITASYIFEEDDLHRFNMSKKGKRIDFDMSLWPVLSLFKESKWFFDGILRSHNTASFIVHPDDINDLPILNETNPYFWPTKATSSLSKNAFTSEENQIYKKLSTHPVFIYQKYKTLLKYILTDTEHYRQIAKLYVREDIKCDNKFLIDVLVDHQIDRMQQFKRTLCAMPAFYAFLQTNGRDAIKSIKNEIQARNRKLKNNIQRYPEYDKLIIKPNDLYEKYKEIYLEAKKQSERVVCQPFDESIACMLKC